MPCCCYSEFTIVKWLFCFSKYDDIEGLCLRGMSDSVGHLPLVCFLEYVQSAHVVRLGAGVN